MVPSFTLKCILACTINHIVTLHTEICTHNILNQVLLPHSMTPQHLTAAAILIKQVHHDTLMSGTHKGRGQTTSGICTFSVFSSWWTKQQIIFPQVHCNQGSLGIFPKQCPWEETERKYLTARALGCYHNETKFGEEATSLLKNHTYTRHNPW